MAAGFGVAVGVGVFVAVGVGVFVDVAVGVFVAVAVGVRVGVFVAVGVGVGVFVAVAVGVGVFVDVAVGVFVDVGVGVFVDVGVGVPTITTASSLSRGVLPPNGVPDSLDGVPVATAMLVRLALTGTLAQVHCTAAPGATGPASAGHVAEVIT